MDSRRGAQTTPGRRGENFLAGGRVHRIAATNARLRVAQAEPSAHERYVHACEEGVRRKRTAKRARKGRKGRTGRGALDEADELATGCTSSKRSA